MIGLVHVASTYLFSDMFWSCIVIIMTFWVCDIYWLIGPRPPPEFSDFDKKMTKYGSGVHCKKRRDDYSLFKSKFSNTSAFESAMLPMRLILVLFGFSCACVPYFYNFGMGWFVNTELYLRHPNPSWGFALEPFHQNKGQHGITYAIPIYLGHFLDSFRRSDEAIM